MPRCQQDSDPSRAPEGPFLLLPASAGSTMAGPAATSLRLCGLHTAFPVPSDSLDTCPQIHGQLVIRMNLSSQELQSPLHRRRPTEVTLARGSGHAQIFSEPLLAPPRSAGPFLRPGVSEPACEGRGSVRKSQVETLGLGPSVTYSRSQRIRSTAGLEPRSDPRVPGLCPSLGTDVFQSWSHRSLSLEGPLGLSGHPPPPHSWSLHGWEAD